MQISHKHQAALSYLYYAYLFLRHLFLTPKSMGLEITGWTPNACSSSFNCFSTLYDDQHKGYLLTQAVIKLLN